MLGLQHKTVLASGYLLIYLHAKPTPASILFIFAKVYKFWIPKSSKYSLEVAGSISTQNLVGVSNFINYFLTLNRSLPAISMILLHRGAYFAQYKHALSNFFLEIAKKNAKQSIAGKRKLQHNYIAENMVIQSCLFQHFKTILTSF